jgi:hypothetical protein
LPLPLPVASANPLKRAAAVWRQQQQQQQQPGEAMASARADPAQAGGMRGAAAAVPPFTAGASARCPSGLEGKCAPVIRASQLKLRLLARRR